MRRMVLVAVLLATAGAWTHTSFAQAAPAGSKAQQWHGGGGWKTAGKAAPAGRQWHVDALRAKDDSLRGHVTLSGSPLASAGNLVGQISGQSVSGNLLDDNGGQIASFTGTITPTGVSGTYTDRTGETGNWSWDGPLPQ